MAPNRAIAAGTDVDSRLSDGSTALHWAVLHDQQEAVATLLASDDPWLRSRVEIAANRVAAQAGEEEYAPAPPGMHAKVGAG